MAHIELREGPGEPRPPLRDGSGNMNIPHTAGSIAWMKDEGGRMKDEGERMKDEGKAEGSQQTMARALHSNEG
jgi:hypothetical protein